MPKLGPDDTVIVLLHGNAKVNNFKFFSLSKLFLIPSTTNITSESRSNSSTCGLQKIPKTWILYFDLGL